MSPKIILMILLLPGCLSLGHSHNNQSDSNHDDAAVTYLGNAALMVSHLDTQVLFDPFFHHHYNQYQLVPDAIRAAIFAGEEPYDSIDLIVISHAHEDHFDANDLVGYLKVHQQTNVVLPQQAIESLKQIEGYQDVAIRVKGVALKYGDLPIGMQIGNTHLDVVRIPHAGWPARSEVSNLVFRVTLNQTVTVMHMGDADPDDDHFQPHQAFWQQQETDRAFPPYWFMLMPAGQAILKNRINAIETTGIHVPVPVPDALKHTSYFSQPGESSVIKAAKQIQLKQQP